MNGTIDQPRMSGTHQWRGIIEEYRDRLPVGADTPVVTLLEGGTPLVPAQLLSERTGCDVYLKVEGATINNQKGESGQTWLVTQGNVADNIVQSPFNNGGEGLKTIRRQRGAHDLHLAGGVAQALVVAVQVGYVRLEAHFGTQGFLACQEAQLPVDRAAGARARERPPPAMMPGRPATTTGACSQPSAP